MSRQTERAAERRATKEAKPGYPVSVDRPQIARGKAYPRSSKREAARHSGRAA